MYPLSSPTTVAVCGCTMSGKTSWVFRLLDNADSMFAIAPKEVLYCYGVYQDAYKQAGNKVSFMQGLPTNSDLDRLPKGHNVVVLDDLMHDVSKDKGMEALFTRGAHHKNLTIIYLTQNLFSKGSRTISLNVHYWILMRSPRDTSQIQTLGRQVFPTRSKALWEAYKDATANQYGYLCLDLSPMANEIHRMRTRIFPGEATVVYQLV